jgi:hypothetical protein
MKTFYDFIRRTSGKLNEAAGDEYDLTKEEDIFFTSTIAKDGNKYYQLKKLKNGKLTTSAIVDIGVKDAALGIYYVLTYSGSKYLFDVHNLDEDSGIDGKPPIGSRLKLMWKEIKDVAKQQQQQQQQQQQTPEPAAPAANTPRAILGVSEDASEAQIKLAYRKLAFQFHPDRNPGDETAAAKFRQVQDAYDELTGKGAQQRGTIEQGAPNQQQPQQQLTTEQYKELIKHIMRQKGIFELSMQKAIDQINNPTHEEIKNMPENDKKEFIEFVSTAPSYKSQIERKIDKLEDNVISYFGPFIVAAVNSQNMDHVASFCCTILMMALGKIKEEQVKQQQQEDSQEHLLALARQLNNPKIRKGLVYMINGNPGRVSVWAAEIKTPQDLQKKYEDWVRRGLIE